jgi:hypothetical protein
MKSQAMLIALVVVKMERMWLRYTALQQQQA